MTDEPSIQLTLTQIYGEVQKTRECAQEQRADFRELRTEVRHAMDQIAENKVDIKKIQRRVWALPSAGVMIALAAVVLSLVGLVNGGG